MPTIHLMVGFLGFGKTTLAKQLEKELGAVRFTHDEIMLTRYGQNIPDFETKYKAVDALIRKQAKEAIAAGQDVIMDYGFWSHQIREEYYNWAKTLTNDVIFHLIHCDMALAKQRAINRQTDGQNFVFDENTFNALLTRYEPWNFLDDYPVVLHGLPTSYYIGQIVSVKIDRPLGSKHPKFGFEYPVNYGFMPFTKSGDGEELDAYVLGIDEPLKTYVGRCIGVIHRTNDNDDKLVVVNEALDLADEQIEAETAFQEKWFKHILIRAPEDEALFCNN